MLTQLRRLVIASNGPDLVAIEDEVLAYPNVAVLDRIESLRSDELALLVPCNLIVGIVELSLFTMLTTFGTSCDNTLDELAVELSFPTDGGSTAAALPAPL